MPDDYQRIAKAIHYLKASSLDQPSLDEAAKHIGLSRFHFQRLFRRFAGVSPKRFVQHLTNEHAKTLLDQSMSILDTSFSVGLSGPSRLHDLLISVDAVTPGEYKSGGSELRIEYAVHSTPFGQCFIALTERGICCLEFIDSTNKEFSIQKLQKMWPKARINENPSRAELTIQQIFNPPDIFPRTPLPLFLQGTNFQLKVWQALLKIPVGCVTSYGYLADKIGQPSASRAVGTAIGNNPIGYLIPCHRVLRGDGRIGGYRWGIERKQTILGKELCVAQSSDEQSPHTGFIE